MISLIKIHRFSMFRKKILKTIDVENSLFEKYYQFLMNFLKQTYFDFVKIDIKKWRVKTINIFFQKMRFLIVEFIKINVYIENKTITKYTQSNWMIFEYQKLFALILFFEISIQTFRFSQHMFQNFRKLMTFSKSRNVILMTTIDIIEKTKSFFSNVMLLFIAFSTNVENISISTIKTIFRKINKFKINFLNWFIND